MTQLLGYWLCPACNVICVKVRTFISLVQGFQVKVGNKLVPNDFSWPIVTRSSCHSIHNYDKKYRRKKANL